jgi:choline dehydrogenase-like flavoprotein
VGIEYRHNGKQYVVRADREVLLCGGVINSPQLLMLSGIGDPDHLSLHRISVKAPLKGVGRNLHDHVVADVRYRRREPGTLHRLLRFDRIAVDLLRTYLFGTGLSGNVPATAVGLIRSEPGLALPDAQIVFAAGPMDAAPYFKPFKQPYTDAFAIKGLMLQPESRGQVLLASADSTAAPLIRQNFLATERDRRTMREIVRRMREIGSRAPLRRFIADELAPGADQTNDEQIDAFIRRTAITLHHPVGTCKMGTATDNMAVVDQNLRVLGVENLCVIDGSAMPQIVRGPTNAPIIMMAEVAADLLRGRSAGRKLAGSESEYAMA